jgi:aminoglycoside phosphotransferase (APT) family kinase protein
VESPEDNFVTDARIDNARRTMIVGLRRLGIDVRSRDLTPAAREWGWVAQIDTARICYFAETDRALLRLERERQLLGALEGRVACAIPSVLAASEDGRLQLRRMVKGDQIQNREPEIGTRQGWQQIADSYGAAIASLHGALDPAEAAALVQPRPDNLPYPAQDLRPLVGRWIRDSGLARAVNAIIEMYAAVVVSAEDRTLIHGDLIADNMIFDLSAGRFLGMFDFAEAEVADRHLDLKYIHSFGRRFAERLMIAYESAAGVALDRQRPAIYHIAAAVSHLRSGSGRSPPPQQARVEQWVRVIIDDAF